MKQRKPKLGQNFLSDESIARRIIDALGDISHCVVVEIGPGKGALTRGLLQRARSLITVEYDRTLTTELREKFSTAMNLEVVEADAVNLDHRKILSERVPAKLVGNLPYYITSDLLLSFFKASACYSEMVLMVQREVAERVCASPGRKEYGMLSVTAQLYCECELLFIVPPEAFTPRPKIHSAVMRLIVAPKIDMLKVEEGPFIEFLKLCFSQKRKTLFNNLRQQHPSEHTQEALRSAGVRADIRAEAVPLMTLAAIFNELKKRI